jgi:hypothetical protein
MLRRALLLSLCFALSACATVAPAPPVDAAMHGDAARPADAVGWIRSELYFSVGTEGQPRTQVDEAQWRAFLDREVTPRFPDGLTVFDGYGQWLFRGAAGPERQRAKVLVVLHEDTPARSADIEAIRAAWKRASGHQSVLWSRQRADVSF